MDAAIGDEKVVEAAAAVTLGSTEEHDVNPKVAAYLARTAFPRLSLKHSPAVPGPILAAVMDHVVFAKEQERLL